MECLELPRILKNLVRDMEPGSQPGDEFIKQAEFGILVDSELFAPEAIRGAERRIYRF